MQECVEVYRSHIGLDEIDPLLAFQPGELHLATFACGSEPSMEYLDAHPFHRILDPCGLSQRPRAALHRAVIGPYGLFPGPHTLNEGDPAGDFPIRRPQHQATEWAGGTE